MFFFSVLPVSIVVKHRRHLGSSGVKGALTKMIKLQVATDQEIEN